MKAIFDHASPSHAMTPGMATAPAAVALAPETLVYDAGRDAHGPDAADFQTPVMEFAAVRNSVLPPYSAA